MAQEVKYPDVTVRLTGTSGNAFAVIGRVSDAIQKRHGADAASNFIGLATGCGSYEELLSMVMDTVHVR
jgi:hypothetical protein